jgi:hypothetical protein
LSGPHEQLLKQCRAGVGGSAPDVIFVGPIVPRHGVLVSPCRMV